MALARQQELMYDYETFKHPVPVDLPIIVLTEGRYDGIGPTWHARRFRHAAHAH